MTAGRDMAKGSASLETDTSPLSDRRASSARRVGSANAANVRSRSCNLTMRLSVGRWGDVSRVWFFCRFAGGAFAIELVFFCFRWWWLCRERFFAFAFVVASAKRCLLRMRFGFFAFLLFCFFAGIRAMPSYFTRRPCPGRHLLFFAAAKKSRQKKAANTPSSSSCLRAPNRSHASHGNAFVRVRCQRVLCTPHPLHVPASQHAVPDSPPPPRWQTVCRLSRRTRITPDWEARLVFLVRALTCAVRQPTHSLPPGRQKPFAAASRCAGVWSG
ncbi:hypothetical protein SAMN05192544_11269 [Paraburkholderia hospita]|nr:hypothetical protein SAMN05192544_11269 [Paraburkholderia hospita]